MTTRPGYIWSGTEWVSIGQEAVVAPVSYQTSAPSSPSTGDIWIDSNDDVPGIDTSQFLRWRKTVSGGETSVSGTDDTGLTLAYTAGYEQVYLNGVLLVRGQDYTATTGTSITGLTALAASDVVEVFGVVARVVGDVYTQAQADAKYSLQTTTGLVLITSATIGTAVSSVIVSSCFNSTYDAYKVFITGGTASANGTLRTQMRNGSTTETGSSYASASVGAAYADGTYARDWNGSSGTYWAYIGYGNNSIGYLHYNVDILNPYLTKPTLLSAANYAHASSTRTGSGYLNTTTSYDSMVISTETGTITGGTIYVYGYKK